MVSVVVSIVVVAAGIVTLASRSRRQRAAPLGAGLTSHRLVYDDFGTLRVLPLDGRPASTLPLPGPTVAQLPISVAGAVVVVSGGRALALGSAGAGPLVDLGAADRVLPAGPPGLIWMIREELGAPVTVQLACVAGNGASCGSSMTAPFPVPNDMAPVAEVQRNLLLMNSSTALVWNPFENRTVFRMPNALSRLVDGRYDHLAWLGGGSCEPNGECPLHITDVTNTTDWVPPPLPGHTGYLPGGAFSPDGRRLATFVEGPTDAPHSVQLVIIDLGAATTRLVRGAVIRQDDVLGQAVWSSDGLVVFFCGASGPMNAYQLDTGKVSTLRVPSSFEFAVQ